MYAEGMPTIMNTAYERTEQKDEWLTPPYIFEALGEFDMDVCEPIKPPWKIAPKGFNVLDNGLAQNWEGFVWCNPPYGKETGKWLERMEKHGNGLCLIFSRTDTKNFQDIVFNATAILFIKGRLSFYDVHGVKGGTAGAASCLVAWGGLGMKRLKESGIKGKLIVLDKNYA